MKGLKRRIVVMVPILMLALSGCKLIDPLPEYSVKPKPLRVRGDSVEVQIDIEFEAKSFHKKAIVEATPILKYEAGETPYEKVTFQGEKVTENHEPIPYQEAKQYTYKDKVPYSDPMNVSQLIVKLDATKGNKNKKLMSDTLAWGVITTPYLLMSDDNLLMGEDNFQRTTKHELEAVIHYLVNSPRVRRSELRDKDIDSLESFIESTAGNDDLQVTGMNITSYASPEGEISRNEDLAKERASSAEKVVQKFLKENEIENSEDFFNKMPKGEDWQGFKEAMQKSDIKDKDLILRVLEMYDDVKKREKEIRNLAETFVVLKDKILPDLRRSEMVLHYNKVGKSDEELKKLALSNADSLNVEELLKAATLFDDLGKKLQVYKAVEQNFPKDWRGPNNAGYVLMMQNKINDAASKFEKANKLNDNAITKNNLGVVARLKGDRQKAAKLFKEAKSAGSEVSYNLGLVNIQNGDYEAAVKNMGNANTFNKALVQTLMDNTDEATRTIDNAPEGSEAMGYYLKAIIGARKESKDMVINNLKSAFSKDGSLKEKAKSDVEFLKYWKDGDFKSLVE